MNKLFTLSALFCAGLIFETFAWAGNPLTDTIITPKRDGAKVIIAPTSSTGTPTDMITADAVAGTVSVTGTMITADYVGTNPEVGGSTPYQLTISNKRHQVINPAGAITIKLPTIGTVASDKWTITNRSSNIVSIQSSGGNAIDSIAIGYITLIALVNAPTAAADWLVLSETKHVEYLEDNVQHQITTSFADAAIFTTTVPRTGTYTIIGKGRCFTGTVIDDTTNCLIRIKTYASNSYASATMRDISGMGVANRVTANRAAGAMFAIWKGTLNAGDYVFLGFQLDRYGSADSYYEYSRLYIQQVDE